MKLQKFIKNKKQKGIVIGSIVGILVLIGGITLYKTFALYKVEKSFNVLNGTVPDFSSGDVTLAITLNGQKVSGTYFPNKDDGFEKLGMTCDDGVIAEWDETNWGLTNIQNPKNASKIKCTIDFSAPTLSEYLKKKVTTVKDGESGLIEQEHDETDQTEKNAITDYRYVGANPNNYVCLEESGQCTEENIYRIIGIIPTQKENSSNYELMVKLIKSTNYVGPTALEQSANSIKGGKGYYIDSGWNKNWTSTNLYKNVLNMEYWNSILNYQKYIENAKWYIGGGFSNNTPSVKNYYIGERTNQQYKNYATSFINYIAIMYPSDYIFAIGSSNNVSRDTCLNKHWQQSGNSECLSTNWLYQGNYDEWTLLIPNSDECCNIFIYGEKGISNGSTNRVLGVRPTFYLKADVLYKNGDGTHDNPYRITISEN